MKKATFTKAFIASIVIALGHIGSAPAYYSAAATLDPGGSNAQATDLASVNCYDDGNGAPDHLSATVMDASAPMPGLLVSLQLFKDTHMTTVTDIASGDGNYSPNATLFGGSGVYSLSVHKTNVGARNFYVAWECQTANNVGTGTGITVLQIQ